MRRETKTTLVLAAVMSLAFVLSAAEPVRWLNVNVVEHDDDHAKVSVHLPIDVVTKVVQAVSVEGFEDGTIDLDIDDAEIDWPKLLEAIRTAPDGDFVTVEADEAHVTISKKAGTIRIHVIETDEDEKATVDVTVPATILDALHFDKDNRLDLKPLLASLASLPNGDLVTVRSEDADVRIWIE